MEISKLFVATKAFVNYQGKILIIKESGEYLGGTNKGKFDVPGGKVKPGERFDEGLKREIKEEVGIKVKIGQPFFTNEWRPIINNEQIQIVGTFFECTPENDSVTLGPDHEEYLWIDPKDYKKFNLIENLRAAFESYLNK